VNPRDHPNAYVGLSAGVVTAFLVSESKRRLGFDLTVEEASFIVSGVISGFLFAGHRLGRKKS
jgi:hypothetical protein